jgi:tripartite-type tricarboxylate transporter receptor subunit TctC
MRWCIIGFAIAVAVVLNGPAISQDYPNRPIRFLQGFAPGGNADTVTRLLGEELARELGQPVISEARPGAGGNLASEVTAKANADGYTIVLLTTAHVISPALYKSLNFDPVNDFEFISSVSDFPFFIVVNSDSRFRTVGDLVTDARNKPNALTIGTAGLGTGQHMCLELLASSVGVKFVHVPFRGDAGAVTALLGSNIDVIIAPATAVLGNVQAGKFRALAVSGLRRWDGLPAVPTVAETVAPGFEMMAWMGVATTRGVSHSTVARLNRGLRKIIALPTMTERLRGLGAVARASTPAETTEWVRAQIKRWIEVAERAGIQRQ